MTRQWMSAAALAVAVVAATSTPVCADLAKSVKYARMHMTIVERFGRFPHRNAILDRSTTPEEAEFLKGPGASF